MQGRGWCKAPPFGLEPQLTARNGIVGLGSVALAVHLTWDSLKLDGIRQLARGDPPLRKLSCVVSFSQ